MRGRKRAKVVAHDHDDDNDDDDDDEGGGGGNNDADGGDDGDEELAASSAIFLVGVNMCGCRPGDACSTQVFESTHAALLHAREHMDAAPLRCPWWGCETGFATRRDVVRHYASHHLLAHWRCASCGDVFHYGARATALKCRHPNVASEPTTQVTQCRLGAACQQQPHGRDMDALTLREHVTAHLEPLRGSAALLTCDWEGCGARLMRHKGLLRHVLCMHLVLAFRCRLCGTEHKKHEQAARCCAHAAGAPQLITLGTKCAWQGCDGAPEFEENSAGDSVRAHIKAHLANCDGQFKTCKWADCDLTLSGTKGALKMHVEVMHARLRLRCSDCGALFPIKAKRQAAMCEHNDRRTKQ